MTDEEKQQLYTMLERHVDQLGEHFDSVRIFATKHVGEGTIALNRGQGNQYAVFGQVTEWITSDKAQMFWRERPE